MTLARILSLSKLAVAVACAFGAADAVAAPKPQRNASPPAVPGEAAPAPSADEMLTSERWRSYGVSLRPPLGSKLSERNADNAALLIADQDGRYVITLFIKKSKSELDIDEVLHSAIEQVGVVHPKARMASREPKRLEASGRPAGVMYFFIPGTDKRGNWVGAQAFVQIDGYNPNPHEPLPEGTVVPRSFAMFQLECDEQHFEAARPIFEAVVQSLESEDPKKLAEQRVKQGEAGIAWAKEFDFKKLQDALVPEQWMRIVADGKDIGYMMITQQEDTQMGQKGIRVDVRARFEVQNRSIDTLSNLFLAEDDQSEFWSTRTTTRDLKPNPKAPDNGSTFAETGIVTAAKKTPVLEPGTITVTRQTPAGVKEFSWPRPMNAYLSQVRMQMLDLILPHDRPAEMGFLAYHPGTGKVAYRTERIEPQPNGGCKVYSRPTPEQPEQISEFDAAGKLVKKVLPNGQVIIPTTKQELASKWQLK